MGKDRKPKYPFEKFQKEIVEKWGANFSLSQGEPYRGIKSLGVLTCQKHGKSWTLPIAVLRQKGKNLCCECCKEEDFKAKPIKTREKKTKTSAAKSITPIDSESLKKFKTSDEESVDFSILKFYKEACKNNDDEAKKEAITAMCEKFNKLILGFYGYWKRELEVKNGGWEKTSLEDYQGFAVLKLISAMNGVKFEKIKDPSIYGFHVQLNHYLQSYTGLALKDIKRRYVNERPLFKPSKTDTEMEVCQLDLELSSKSFNEEHGSGVSNIHFDLNKTLFWEAVEASNQELDPIQRSIWEGKQKNLKTKDICDSLKITPYMYTLNLKHIKKVFSHQLQLRGLSGADFS